MVDSEDALASPPAHIREKKRNNIVFYQGTGLGTTGRYIKLILMVRITQRDIT